MIGIEEAKKFGILQTLLVETESKVVIDIDDEQNRAALEAFLSKHHINLAAVNIMVSGGTITFAATLDTQKDI